MKRMLLQGIRVADFGWVQTGPQTGRFLADCGAEVIKIEGRTKPDVIRRAGSIPVAGGPPSPNRSAVFNDWNVSKLSLAMNLSRPKAAEVAKRLVAKSDVVIENFAAGAIERMGLGYEELKKVKPDIIMVGSCGLGHTGPFATNPAHGDVLVGLSGITQITGWPDRMPSLLGFYTDFIGPRINAMVITAALDYRSRTGEGMYIDMSQSETALHFMAPLLLDYAVNGRIANRMGNRSTYAAPHGVFRCRGDDRWCAIAVFSDKEWQSLVKVIGSPAWTKDARFTTFLARKKNEDELERLIGEWTAQHTAEEVMEMLQKAGVSAGVLETGEDLLEHDPQLKHQHFFREVDHPEVGKYRARRTPFFPSKAYYELRRAPLLGEHNNYVLKELLGMSDEEVAALVAEGVIE